MTITIDNFLQDPQGRRFSDVVNDPDIDWGRWVRWLSDGGRQSRFEMAEQHFGMPALASVLKELESEDFVQVYFRNHGPKDSLRVKQALGVLVRLHMEARGWRTTGSKGPLGRRDTKATDGAHNTNRSSSRCIRSAEHYRKGD